MNISEPFFDIEPIENEDEKGSGEATREELKKIMSPAERMRNVLRILDPRNKNKWE